MTATGAPYVTFVSCARNDGYGNGLSRIQHSLDVLYRQLHDLSLEAEIILVDWNPPRQVPPLRHALRFPGRGGCVSTRVVEVPGNLHCRYHDHEYAGMNAVVAFNVGLRRARGRFVLVRSSDVYYTDAVLARMARRDLAHDTVYRVERYDIDAATLTSASPAAPDFLDACARHVIQRHTASEPPSDLGVRSLHTNACGDFMLMSVALLRELRGYKEGRRVLSPESDGLLLHAAAGLGARQKIWPDPCRVYKPVHAGMTVRSTQYLFRPHERLLDALAARLCSRGMHMRLRILLDFPRRRMRGFPELFPSYERTLLRPARQWARGKGPFWANELDWGLGSEPLPEYTVCPADWEARPATVSLP